jgi:hypothetical protein
VETGPTSAGSRNFDMAYLESCRAANLSQRRYHLDVLHCVSGTLKIILTNSDVHGERPYLFGKFLTHTGSKCGGTKWSELHASPS